MTLWLDGFIEILLCNFKTTLKISQISFGLMWTKWKYARNSQRHQTFISILHVQNFIRNTSCIHIWIHRKYLKVASLDLSKLNFKSMFCSFISLIKWGYRYRFKNVNYDSWKNVNVCLWKYGELSMKKFLNICIYKYN